MRLTIQKFKHFSAFVGLLDLLRLVADCLPFAFDGVARLRVSKGGAKTLRPLMLSLAAAASLAAAVSILVMIFSTVAVAYGIMHS